MSSRSSDSELDPLDRLAEEFLARCRRGERPTITEYAQKYPHLADRIREFFPTLRIVIAVDISRHDIQLLHPGTGEPLATLQSPSPEPIILSHFSPDGHLLAVATETGVIQLWDLRAIRQGLAKVGLDWDLPSLPRAEEAGHTPPVPVQVDVGELGRRAAVQLHLARADNHRRNQEYAKAIDEM